MMSAISVVIPVVNEEALISACLKKVRALGPWLEMVVVDGGSTDRTAVVAQEEQAVVINSPPGRGRQLNRGAAKATGDILVFLHVDTVLPDQAFRQIQDLFAKKETQVACFRLKFDHGHWLLKLYSFFTRFDSVFTRFGDQVIVVRREFFTQEGGFPEWPLFEDVEFFRRARRKTRVRQCPSSVVTSARRFLEGGMLRQQLKNCFLLCQFLRGVHPVKLAAFYPRKSVNGG